MSLPLPLPGNFPTTATLALSSIATLSSMVLFLASLIFRYRTLRRLGCDKQEDEDKKTRCERNTRFIGYLLWPVHVLSLFIFVVALITAIAMYRSRYGGKAKKQKEQNERKKRAEEAQRAAAQQKALQIQNRKQRQAIALLIKERKKQQAQEQEEEE